MACQHCLEQRAKVMKMIGLGRWAPNVTPVAEVNGAAAVSEIDAQAHIRAQFARYLANSDGVTASTIIFAAVHLIAFALGQVCNERPCAEEQIDAVCDTLRGGLLTKYDKETGKRRQIVEAKLFDFD